MSASALVTIFCDYPLCGQWEDAGIAPTAKEARAQLRGHGWRLGVRSIGPAQDYCPRHNPTPPTTDETRKP